MFLHYNLRRAKCLRHTDSGSTSEFYFTWRAYIDGSESVQLAQGFSLGCPMDDGYSMRAGDSREFNDPRFTIELPDVAKGETKRAVLDVFAWEADSSADENKRLFTNDAAQKLMQIYERTERRKKQTQEAFLDWVQDGSNEVVSGLVDAGAMSASSVVPYVAVAKAGVKLLDWALSAIKNNSDDYLGLCRAEVLYTRNADNRLLYRWIFNNGVESWFQEERPVIHQSWRVTEANRENELDCKFIVQIVEKSPTEFSE